MMDDDDRTLTEDKVLEAFTRGRRNDVQELEERIDANLRLLQDCTNRHIAAMQRVVSVYRKLEAMKLPIDQELMLYNLLTLPDEALELVKERLGVPAKLEK
jgi:ATP-dependent protease HslVU (ClpYQ) peptidase subunit